MFLPRFWPHFTEVLSVCFYFFSKLERCKMCHLISFRIIFVRNSQQTTFYFCVHVFNCFVLVKNISFLLNFLLLLFREFTFLRSSFLSLLSCVIFTKLQMVSSPHVVTDKCASCRLVLPPPFPSICAATFTCQSFQFLFKLCYLFERLLYNVAFCQKHTYVLHNNLLVRSTCRGCCYTCMRDVCMCCNW